MEIHPIQQTIDQYLSSKMVPIHEKLGPSEEDVNMGDLKITHDIPSSITSFQSYPDYIIPYPPSVVDAISLIVQDYNVAFGPLVDNNKEFPNDYAPTQVDGKYVNYFVQVDMAAIPTDFLKQARGMSADEVRQYIAPRVFEVENSLAMYNFMRGVFDREANGPVFGGSGDGSSFGRNFDASLRGLAKHHGMPVTLFAATDEKYVAMLQTEFGKLDATPETALDEERVQMLSGFDRLIGPNQMQELLNNGDLGNLVYARTSLPTRVLGNPTATVDMPVLADRDNRREIKQHGISLNIDAPDAPRESLINDTKAYMHPLGLGFEIHDIDDLRSDDFRYFMWNRGIEVQSDFDFRKVGLRAKPRDASYGAYGHHRFTPGQGSKKYRKFETGVRAGIAERGPYIVQPEIPPQIFRNNNDGIRFGAIDRNFFHTSPSGKIIMMGGFRNMIPVEDTEFKKGRIHGNKSAAWAEIISE